MLNMCDDRSTSHVIMLLFSEVGGIARFILRILNSIFFLLSPPECMGRDPLAEVLTELKRSVLY